MKSDNTDITGPEAMAGKMLCSVTGSTSAQKVKDNYAADVALQEVRHLHRVRRGAEEPAPLTR